MNEHTTSGLFKRTIPPDLQIQLEDLQKKVPRTSGSPGDLDDRKKRWLVVGICLHTIISPVLRSYVVPVVTKLCYSLTRLDKIHKQTYGSHLKRYPPSNTELNYEAINSNKTKYGRKRALYDYRVKSPVDLSRLFLQTHMAHFTAFDDSCDSSALLGIIVNIGTFPSDVQCDANQIRSNIRNSWAHCDFSEWSSTKYANSFQLMGQLLKHLRLNNREENKILGELNKWATNGQNFLNGTTLGLEIVDKMRQQTHVLSEYVQTLCTEGENQFIRVQKVLRELENDLQKMLARIQKLEIESKKHEEKIENVSALTTSVSKEIEDLKAVVKRQERDHIPKNIQAQHNREIQEWKNDEATFLETRATKHILTSLLSNDVIIVTGSSGCGKSSNIHHAALYLHDRFGYEIIPVLTGPSDIINYNNENKKQVFVEDDICGKESINLQTLHIWRDYSEKLEKFFKTVENDAENEKDGKFLGLSGSKLLISCRLHIYKEAQFQLLKLLTRKEYNLISPEWCLQQGERINMMQKYVPGDINLIDNVKHVTDHDHFFPLICKLSKGKSSDEVIKLLTAPVNSINKNINHIVLINKAQFCALVLCILFDDGFNTDWLMLKSAPGNKKCKLVNIVKEFEIDLSSEIARNTLKAGFSTLDETYFKRRGKEYRMIHDKIFEMAAIICGNQLTECFIRYAPTVFIRDHFIFESNIEVSANDDLIILSQDREEDYFERLLMDLKESISVSTFYNKQLIHQSFRDKLISFFGRSDDAKQLLLEFDFVDSEGCVVKSDKKDFCWFMEDTTPLMESASCGYFDIVCFLIETVKCDVNQINFEGKSPLFKACEGGHTDVVKLLVQNNANVYQTESDMYREFPLFVACSEGHTEIVKLLLQKDADVYQCNLNEESPLYVACKRGHTDIVKLLLQNNASISQCNNAEKSPLYAACKRGHIDTLKLLLKNHAEVSKCSIFGFSPLFVACKGGHTETVKLLLQNNADVSQCNNYRMSPLFVASERGHKDTVKLLLPHSSDVALCDELGVLYCVWPV